MLQICCFRYDLPCLMLQISFFCARLPNLMVQICCFRYDLPCLMLQILFFCARLPNLMFFRLVTLTVFFNLCNSNRLIPYYSNFPDKDKS